MSGICAYPLLTPSPLHCHSHVSPCVRVQANYCVFVVQQLQGVLNLSGLPFGGPICSPLSATSVGILTTFASNADAERWRDTFLTSLSFLVNYAQVRERGKRWWARAAARRELGVEQAGGKAYGRVFVALEGGNRDLHRGAACRGSTVS